MSQSAGPILSKASDAELTARHHDGDRSALDELVRRYRPLASALARKYSYTSEASDDLEQVACLGLVAAINRFDPSRGKTLRAFAVPTILGELRRHFRDTGWAVHMPRQLQESARTVQDARTKMSAHMMRSPTPREVADYLEIPVESVIESLTARQAYSPESLDAPPKAAADASETSWDSIHGAEELGYARAEDKVSLERALRALPEREQEIINLRFGAELSQSEIGTALGISQMHVSRLLRRGLDRVGTIVTNAADSDSYATSAH